MKSLHTLEETVQLIQSKETLVLAGSAALIQKLPKGNWIAGTIPYFVGEQGGIFSEDLIHVARLTPYAIKTKIKTYDAQTISDINNDAFDNGFSVIIMPSNSKVHFDFAVHAPHFPKFGYNPLIGWVSGTDLKKAGKDKPLVFSGLNQEAFCDKGVVMHVGLAEGQFACVQILNIFDLDEGSDSISFLEDAFMAKEALVNGQRVNFAHYLKDKCIDTKVPLVADYNGTKVNIAYQFIGDNEVKFYSPVFKNLVYKQAKPMNNYVQQFTEKAKACIEVKPLLSFNCVLNYLYGELEGEPCGDFSYPCTFGEIAYQLFTQTLVRLTIKHSVENKKTSKQAEQT